MATQETPIDNGVNVAGPARRPQRADRRPGGRRVHVARHIRVGARHAQQDHDRGLLRPRRRAEPQAPRSATTPTTPRSSPPRTTAPTPVEFVLVGLASCLTAGVAAVAQNRGIQLELGQGHDRGRHEHPRHPRRRPRGAQRLQRHPGQLRDRRRRRRRTRSRRSSPSRRSARPSSTSITNPTNVTVDGQLSRLRASPCARPTVVIGAGHAGLAISHVLSRALDRPRRPRARRGRQHVADRALGLAPAAHAQLAEPPARLRLRRRRPRRLHDDARGGRASSTRYADRDRRAGADRHDRSRASAASTAATASRPTTGAGRRRPWCSPAARSTAPHVPDVAAALPAAIDERHAARLPATRPAARRAACSSSARRPPGIQIADELHRSGRPVTARRRRARAHAARPTGAATSCGGCDATGLLDERYDEVDDLVRGRHVPSPQLVGTPDRARPRPQRPHAPGRRARRAARRDPRRHRPVLRLAAQQSASSPTSSWTRLLDTIDEWALGDRPRRRRRRRRTGPSRRASTDRAAARARPARAARSRRSSGRPASAPTTRGSTCRCSTARGDLRTTAASSGRARACT